MECIYCKTKPNNRTTKKDYMYAVAISYKKLEMNIFNI